MALDSKAIETIAVSAVKNSIVLSEFLDPIISENDKEPSWDGFVYIYEDKSKKKSKLSGRIPIQVKGKECDDHSKNTISFPMSTVDLKNYLYDGGCILFVVYIKKNGVANKIYYNELIPIKLRQLLKEAKNKNSKTIYLKEFPSDNNRKANIFFSCLKNCKKQASFTECKIFSLEELEKQENIENIIIPFSSLGYNNHINALINNEIYIYAKIKGSTALQPIDIIPTNLHIKEEKEATITIDNKIFYSNYHVIKNVKETILCYGDSFRIIFNEKADSCRIKYKNSNKIRILAKDLDFALTYLDKGYFKVDDIEFTQDYKSLNFPNFNIQIEQENLLFAKKIVQVLDMLGCDDDIDINVLSDKDWMNLNILIEAFVDEKIIKGLQDDLPPLVFIDVGKLRFLVYLKKCKGKGSYRIFDFFKTNLSVVYEDENNIGEKIPTSQFSVLKVNDFLTLSNIDFDILLPSFKSIEHHYSIFDEANIFLLVLLNAYDRADDSRKEKLLKTCKDFSEWISEAPEDKLNYEIRTLNVLQTIKRYRDFNNDEIRILYSIVENGDTREDFIVGAYLLLGQQQAAEIHFEKMSEEEQNNFKEYPIYHFWKTELN